MNESDLELLTCYGRRNSEEAFAELVRRYTNLVYSAALRQVRSPQLAEEVAQSVFADLARNVHKMKPDTILGAWLHRVTRCAALVVVRRESRRHKREQTALEMAAIEADSPEWNGIAPLLDEAMEALDETDRSAIILRFFENKSLREVGESLGTSEDAAQKRVSRAVERLRDFFSNRGVGIGTAGLAAVLSANAVQSAPAGLSAALSAAAVAGAAGPTAGTIAVTREAALTGAQKLLVTAAVVVVAALGTWIYLARSISGTTDRERNGSNTQDQTQAVPLQTASAARGQLPLSPFVRRVQSLSAAAGMPGQPPDQTNPVPSVAVEADLPVAPVAVMLSLPRQVHGQVVDEAGQPVPGAAWTIGRTEVSQDGKWIKNPTVELGNWRDEFADAEGRFVITFASLVRYDLQFHKPGFAPAFLFEIAADSPDLKVTMKRGESIHGTVTRMVNGKAEPVAGQWVQLRLTTWDLEYAEHTTTDASGAFGFRACAPPPELPSLWRVICGEQRVPAAKDKLVEVDVKDGQAVEPINFVVGPEVPANP
jgi:RNA polymerase sigma factor (sigma-70 family)